MGAHLNRVCVYMCVMYMCAFMCVHTHVFICVCPSQSPQGWAFSLM